MPRDPRSYIAGGHVYCKIEKRDMDIDQCVGCARLRTIDEKASPPYLVCESSTVPSEALLDPEFMSWWHQHHRPAR